MENIFNPVELVEMGIEKEKKRRDFYAAAAEAAVSDELKTLFRRLSAWEEEHIRRFSEIRGMVEERPSAESYPGELGDYMRALISGRLYSGYDPAEWSRDLKEPRRALKKGIGFEKDAILFFQELAPFLSGPGREVVGLLIKEEKDHLVYLARLAQRLED